MRADKRIRRRRRPDFFISDFERVADGRTDERLLRRVGERQAIILLRHIFLGTVLPLFSLFLQLTFFVPQNVRIAVKQPCHK